MHAHYFVYFRFVFNTFLSVWLNPNRKPNSKWIRMRLRVTQRLSRVRAVCRMPLRVVCIRLHLSHIPSGRRTMSGHRRISAPSEHRRKKMERSVGDRSSLWSATGPRSIIGRCPADKCLQKMKFATGNRCAIGGRRTMIDRQSSDDRCNVMVLAKTGTALFEIWSILRN